MPSPVGPHHHPLLPTWYGIAAPGVSIAAAFRATLRFAAAGVAVTLGLAWIAAAGRGGAARRRGRVVARLVLLCLAVHVRQRGTAPAGRTLLACNHVSWLDSVVLLARTGGRFFAIDWMFNTPLLAAGLRAMECIPVRRAGLRTLPLLVTLVGSAERVDAPLLFFPEADTSRGASVTPFRGALLEGAIRAQRPVWWAAVDYRVPGARRPAGLVVAWADWTPLALHVWRLAHARRVEARVQFADRPVGATSRRDLAAELHRRVLAAFRPLEQAPPDLTRRFSRPPPVAPDRF